MRVARFEFGERRVGGWHRLLRANQQESQGSDGDRVNPFHGSFLSELRLLLLVTELAVAADRRAILCLVLVVVTAHASGRIDVSLVVRIAAESHLHRREHVVSVGVLDRGGGTIDRLLIDGTAM